MFPKKTGGWLSRFSPFQFHVVVSEARDRSLFEGRRSSVLVLFVSRAFCFLPVTTPRLYLVPPCHLPPWPPWSLPLFVAVECFLLRRFWRFALLDQGSRSSLCFGVEELVPHALGG